MKKALVWIRRDLRLHDHSALSYATNNFEKTFLVFIFDTNILLKITDKSDHRITFLHDTLQELREKLNNNIYILHGDPKVLIPELAKDLEVDCVCTNEDYEPYAIKRDDIVRKNLDGIEFRSFKDQVIFNADEIRNGSDDFYKVFTPYKNNWFQTIEERPDVLGEKKVNLKNISYSKLKGHGLIPSLTDLGFKRTQKSRTYDPNPTKKIKDFLKKIDDYENQRDLPAVDGTSSLSPYLRFGQISVRELMRKAWTLESAGAKVWMSELAWRDFYFGILKTFPHVEKHAYTRKYENIPWENDKKKFKAWCEGSTGVPIVDAGMRQLNLTGWMHNRVRMIVASYLTKTLLIDWRWGEKYFAEKLIDFDLAANNGGWQWSASTGCDAAPYFRVFNPYRQSERFDPDAQYILKYVSELADREIKFIHDPTKMKEKDLFTSEYPDPIVDYSFNREKIISLFKRAGSL